MLALSPVAPVVGWRSSQRLPRDHYVRLDGNDYSVHPSVIGRRIEITADLHRVRVFCDGRIVADHERVWAKHQTVHDSEHLAAATTLRRQRLEVVRPPVETEVETRRLSDYDALVGVDGGVA
jgi:transposase